jgi:dihydropteroate synthase
MGVVNITPDSFSDGGRFLDAKAAVARARKLHEDGADIIDIGASRRDPAPTRCRRRRN